jgi:hydrogenase nickel incorporation protein HypB
MCMTCGCDDDEASVTDVGTGERRALSAEAHAHAHAHGHPHDHGDPHRHGHEHAHGRDHGHDHDHGHEAHAHDHEQEPAHPLAAPTQVIEMEAKILARNGRAAERNRAWFQGREILALNLMSAPGAGKTTLLERTVAALKGRRVFVLEGDQATSNDGDRMQAAGARAVQINTGKGCHLDAEMVTGGLAALRPDAGALVFIENVGNLVCPALFDLGEARRVAILSVTEGDDKPLKYPHMFKAADLMLLNKVDLAPHVDFDRARAAANAREVNPAIEIIEVSARTGEGLKAWLAWIERAHAALREAAFA